MLRAAVAGHLATAALTAGAAALTGRSAGHWLAGFFLPSTVFRPVGPYSAQLRGRLSTLLKDVGFPRDDVLELRSLVDMADAGGKVLEEKAEEQYQALAEIRRAIDDLAEPSAR
ncbi:hypothetical protein [Streptomyces sp. IBSBF 2435]|uniref:hypothetical protein n=1 Tax=Streptomyces sp. IBSBF 2435 TaxID=2903531 RepID=UPI002FDB9E77